MGFFFILFVLVFKVLHRLPDGSSSSSLCPGCDKSLRIWIIPHSANLWPLEGVKMQITDPLFLLGHFFEPLIAIPRPPYFENRSIRTLLIQSMLLSSHKKKKIKIFTWSLAPTAPITIFSMMLTWACDELAFHLGAQRRPPDWWRSFDACTPMTITPIKTALDWLSSN